MECVSRPVKNCCPDGKCSNDMCPSTHDCCWQVTGNGSPATLGICVKKGNCDSKRGIPKKGCKDSENKFKYTEKIAIENIKSKEGYNSINKCSNKTSFFLLLIILGLAIIILRNLQTKN